MFSHTKLLRTLAAGALFYTLAVACDSAKRIVVLEEDAGEVLADVFSSPVAEASAAEPAETSEETCQAGPSGTFFALHRFAGRSVDELASVRVLGRLVASGPTNIGGEDFEWISMIPYVRAGAVAVSCGAGGVKSYERVRFIRP